MAGQQFINLQRDMRLTQIGFFLLLTLGTESVFAEPRSHDRPKRPYLQNAVLDRSVQGSGKSDQHQPEGRRTGNSDMPATSGYAAQGDSGSGSQDNARRQGRMSPEERRVLRRQIDEVGHDIYSPKR